MRVREGAIQVFPGPIPGKSPGPESRFSLAFSMGSAHLLLAARKGVSRTSPCRIQGELTGKTRSGAKHGSSPQEGARARKSSSVGTRRGLLPVSEAARGRKSEKGTHGAGRRHRGPPAKSVTRKRKHRRSLEQGKRRGRETSHVSGAGSTTRKGAPQVSGTG